MSIKVIYFIEDAIPTPLELEGIAAIEALNISLMVRTATQDARHGASIEDTDYVAGSVPSSYAAVPVYVDGNVGKVLYFIEGAVPTVSEQGVIDALNFVKYDVVVRNIDEAANYGARIEGSDYVAGTPPAAYSGVPLFADTLVGPTVTSLPAVAPLTARIGTQVTRTQGVYEARGGGTVSVVRQFVVNGVQVGTGNTRTPVAGDHGGTFEYVETATETGGTADGVTERRVAIGTITYALPVAGTLADVVEEQDTGDVVVNMAAGFTGTTLTYTATRGTVAGANLTLSTASLFDGNVTVTATDPDGQQAQVTFALTVTEVLPLAPTAITINEPGLPVYDTDIFGANSVDITFSGTMTVAEPNVVLQYRVRDVDAATTLINWTDLTVASQTDWEVTLTRSASKASLQMDIRGKFATGVTASQSEKCYAGHVVGFLGQSLIARPLVQNVVATFVPPANQMYVLFNDQNGTLADGPQIVGNASVLALRRMAAVVDEYFDAPVLIVDMTHSGTGRGGMFDDTDTDRDWDETVGDPVAYVRSRGTDVCVVIDHWFTNDAATYLEFARQWSPGYVRRQIGGLGDNDDSSGVADYVSGQVAVVSTREYTPTNFLWDLSAAGDAGLFDASRTKWFPMFGAAHWNATVHTDGEVLANDVQKGGIRKALEDLTSDPAFDAITLSTVAGYSGAEAFGGHLAQPAETHVASGDVDGEPLVGVYLMTAVARALGYLVRQEPRVASVAFAAGGVYADVTFDLEHGGRLSTAFIEHAAGNYAGSFEADEWVLPTTDPATLDALKEVQGFTVTQGGGSLTFANFTAVIQDANAGIVRITPTTPFIDGDTINFGYGDGVHLLTPADVAAARPHVRWPIETRPHVSGAGYGWPVVRESGDNPLFAASGIGVVVPDTFTTAGATPTYFVDPNNVPANTNVIEFRGRMSFPTQPGNSDNIFSQESGGADLRSLSNGKLRIFAEDGTGLGVLAGTEGDINLIPGTGAMHDYVLNINHTTEEATFTYDSDAPVVIPFARSGNGVFQSNREVAFLANSSGGVPVPVGTEVEYLEVYFDGVLHKRIAGNAATVNADAAWKRGDDAV